MIGAQTHQMPFQTGTAASQNNDNPSLSKQVSLPNFTKQTNNFNRISHDFPQNIHQQNNHHQPNIVKNNNFGAGQITDRNQNEEDQVIIDDLANNQNVEARSHVQFDMASAS